MRALVLSGGGGRGAYELGVYKALREEGLEPDIVSGTSVGAIGAAFIAAGTEPEDIEALWEDMTRRNVFTVRRDVHKVREWTHLLDNSPLRELLEERLDLWAVRESDVRVLVTAVRVSTGEFVVFENEELTVDHLLASSAFPFLFPMVEIDGVAHWDGGLVGYTPVTPALDAGATEIYAVIADPVGHGNGHVPTRLSEAWDRAFDVMITGHLRRDLEVIETRNRLVEAGQLNGYRDPVDVHVISPGESIPARVLTFDGDTARHLIERGEADGRRYLEALER